MKKSGVLGILVILYSLSCCAQTVSIPDPVFRTCLEKKHASTLDSNKNLILAEAAKVTGDFSCGHSGLKNAEGIQYFTSIDDLDISYNNLSSVPDISASKKLQVFDISDNQITEIQDMASFSELKDLDLKNNRLKKFPDISKNTKLEILSAPTNYFDSLPALNTLPKLRLLYVENNQLLKLPDLKNQIALTSINASNNRLKNLPALVQLKSLGFMDVSFNLLTSIPALPPGIGLRSINFADNELSSLPEFPSNDSLKTVLLKNNNLSFEDFIPFRSRKNFENIFQLAPQKRKIVGYSKEYKEGDPILLQTNVDKGIAQVKYEWFLNGKSVASVSADSFLIKSATFASEGYYFAKITHPLFPNVILETDSFFVKVLPCLSLTDFSTVITSITCEKGGTLQISYPDNNNKNINFTLTGLGTQKIFVSEKGIFSNLTEPLYSLTISNGAQCTKLYSDSLVIPVDHCDQPYISPDGDGVNDTYFFTGKGKATMSDKWGNVVHHLDLPDEWNGTNSQGIVAPGLYLVNINDGEQIIKISVVY